MTPEPIFCNFILIAHFVSSLLLWKIYLILISSFTRTKYIKQILVQNLSGSKAIDAVPVFIRQKLLHYYLQKLKKPLPLKYVLEAIVIQIRVTTILDLSKQYSGLLVSSGYLCFTYTSSYNIFLVRPPALRLNILISVQIPPGAQGSSLDLHSLNMWWFSEVFQMLISAEKLPVWKALS